MTVNTKVEDLTPGMKFAVRAVRGTIVSVDHNRVEHGCIVFHYASPGGRVCMSVKEVGAYVSTGGDIDLTPPSFEPAYGYSTV